MPIHKDRLLYQDEHFLAVNKLAGELVVKGSGTVQKLPLFDFLKKDFPGIHPLNRLDYETSGIVLFARNKNVLAEMLQVAPKWKKIYRTIVLGHMPKKEGTIDRPLPARSGKGDAKAVTHFKVLEEFLGSSYVEAEIESGKYHQIRKHFAMIKRPLALDDEYGDEKFNRLFMRHTRFSRFFLHAYQVSFEQPYTKKQVVIEAPLPQPFEAVLKKLRSA
jgi:RluA family pseudouridine synthase